MTKEGLYNEFYDSEYEIKGFLDKFFESNVCIPKGTNRHPYADVLHEWVEGVEVEMCSNDCWDNLRDVYAIQVNELLGRIKELESDNKELSKDFTHSKYVDKYTDESKSCNGGKYSELIANSHTCINCKRIAIDYYEPKDNE
jgi:hypothetical protein